MIDAREDYARISLKTLSSFPEYAFYDSAYPLGNLFYVSGSEQQLRAPHRDDGRVAAIRDGSDCCHVPPGYMAAIRFNLAASTCAVMYQIDPTRSLVRSRLNAKRVIKRMNVQIPP
jgi:hypothetical protein